MLRAANHSLAAENDMLRRWLRPFAQIASPKLSWAMVEYCIEGDPEKQALQAPQMQRAFNRAADALREDVPAGESADTSRLDLPDWVVNAKPHAPQASAVSEGAQPVGYFQRDDPEGCRWSQVSDALKGDPDIFALYKRPTARAEGDATLFCDLRSDEEKSNFFLSGQGYSSGVIAKAIQNDVAMAYHRCAEYAKAMRAEGGEAVALPSWFEAFLVNVCEIPDRNSPEDEPEAIVATLAELRDCALSAIENAARDAQAGKEGV
jgi:hypothetical protein